MVVPDLVERLVAGDEMAGCTDEEAEELRFAAAERNLHVAAADDAALEIEDEVSGP